MRSIETNESKFKFMFYSGKYRGNYIEYKEMSFSRGIPMYRTRYVKTCSVFSHETAGRGIQNFFIQLYRLQDDKYHTDGIINLTAEHIHGNKMPKKLTALLLKKIEINNPEFFI